MTLDERKANFLADYEALKAAYGLEIAVRSEVRRFGAMIQIEPVIGLQEVADWPDLSPAATDHPASQ